MALAPNGVAGTSTGSNSTTVVNDTGKSWTTNQWANYTVILTSGSLNKQQRTISSNTATSFTVSAAFGGTPSTDSYQIANTGPVNPTFHASGVNSFSMSLGVGVGSGSLIVVSANWSGSGNTVSAVTVADNQSHTYTNAVFQKNVSTFTAGVLISYYVTTQAYSAPYTVTVTLTGGSGLGISAGVVEFTGSVSAPNDQNATANPSTTSVSTGTTAATAANCQLSVIGFGCVTSEASITEPTGYTMAMEEINSSSFTVGAMSYRYSPSVLASTTVSATYTVPTAAQAAAGVATFDANTDLSITVSVGVAAYMINGPRIWTP